LRTHLGRSKRYGMEGENSGAERRNPSIPA
jgi:hypothetical protein